MELAGPLPLYAENSEGQAQVVLAPTGLCQTQTLKHYWEAQNDVWAAVPTGPPGCTAHMSGHTGPGIGLVVVPGDGPICLLRFRKLLQSGLPIGKCLRCDTG